VGGEDAKKKKKHHNKHKGKKADAAD